MLRVKSCGNLLLAKNRNVVTVTTFTVTTFTEPDPKSYDATCEAYQKWKRVLERKLETVI